MKLKNKGLLRLAMSRPGQFVGIRWNRPLKAKKGIASEIRKEVELLCRVGVNHDSREVVMMARKTGLAPRTNQGLPWGRWLFFPYLIIHGLKVYLRIYPVANHQPKEKFFINGQEARREEIQDLVYSSELDGHEKQACINLNIEHLIGVW